MIESIPREKTQSRAAYLTQVHAHCCMAGIGIANPCNQNGEPAIDGIGVLRYPLGRMICAEDEPDVPAAQVAAEVASLIGRGSILSLPNDRDEDTHQYLWDFTVVGGQQIEVRRK